MKILILGGNGQLGRSLISTLWNSETDLLAPLRSDLDVTDFEKLKDYLITTHPDVVINATAWTNVPGAESDPDGATKLNAEAVGNIATTCSLIGALLVHISTDYVFDGESDEPYKETDGANPLNAYGKSKLLGESAIQSSSLKDFYIVRTSWLYSKFGKNFVKTIAMKALNGEPSSITDDQFGVPTFAGDLAVAIKSLIEERPVPGIFHFSNTGETNWFEFGSAIYELLGADRKLVSPRKTEGGELRRPKYSVFDLTKWKTSKLSPLVDWKIRLEKELPSIIEALKSEAN